MKLPNIRITKDNILFGCFVVISLIAIGIGGRYLASKITVIRAEETIRQPIWEQFDKEDTTHSFALTKIAFKLVPGDGKEGTNYFFRNRMTLNGSTTDQECYKTQYKCGDSKWTNLEFGSVILQNRCIIRIKPDTFCNVILPGGTLIAASNDRDTSSNILHFYEKDLFFQVITTDERITIIQSVTKQESSLWHTLAPNFDKEYVVELGDQLVEATGTEFNTSTEKEKGSITTVTKGSVKIYDTTINKGQFAQIPPFNIAACPSMLKACGNSCIPANGICCDTNSYCLSPVQCQENPTSSCKANLFSGDSSQFCCYNNQNANFFSLFEKGSYDCNDGYKFCANKCIPEDQECCYPTEDNCPVPADELDIGTGKTPSEYVFPRQYFFDLYNKLISNSKYIKLISDPSFAAGTLNFNTILDYISDYLKPVIEKDYAKSNSKEEETKYCSNYPGSAACSTTKKSNDTSGSISGNCSMMDDIEITWCYRENGNTKAGYVFCGFKYVKNKDKYCKSSGNMVCADTGDGTFPKECLPKGFNSWVNP